MNLLYIYFLTWTREIRTLHLLVELGVVLQLYYTGNYYEFAILIYKIM